VVLDAVDRSDISYRAGVHREQLRSKNRPLRNAYVEPDDWDWWRGPAVEHWSLADVLSLSYARLVVDGDG